MRKDWFYRCRKEITQYLNESNWKEYSRHSICRFRATAHADAVASMSQLKKYGGWKSSAVAEEYHANSLAFKINKANTTFKSINGNDDDHNHDHNH